MLKLACPHPNCGYTAENVPDKYAGKTVKCPKCKQGGVRLPDIELELDDSVPEPTPEIPPTRQKTAYPEKIVAGKQYPVKNQKKKIAWAVAASVLIFGFAYGMSNDKFQSVFFKTLSGRLGDDTEDYQKRITAETRTAAELKDKTIRDREIAKTEREIEDLKRQRDAIQNKAKQPEAVAVSVKSAPNPGVVSKPDSDKPEMPLDAISVRKLFDYAQKNNDSLMPCLKNLQLKGYGTIQDKICILKFHAQNVEANGWDYEKSLSRYYFELGEYGEEATQGFKRTRIDTFFEGVAEICNDDRKARRQPCSSLKGVLSDDSIKEAIENTAP